MIFGVSINHPIQYDGGLVNAGRKRLRKQVLGQVGVTENGQPVVAGFFTLVDGQGISLDIVLHHFNAHGLIPEWRSFFAETLDRGWNPRSTLSKIEQACADVYGKDHAKVVIERLNLERA